MSPKIPSLQEFFEYKGAHTHRLWVEVGSDWVCPACRRTKFQILRWTTRFPGKPNAFKDWMAPLHKHHDHSVELRSNRQPRFPQTIICDQCNSSDGAAKRTLKLPKDFSFSPSEIGLFVIAKPHTKHTINSDIAHAIYLTLL